jgi:hypothetical protein
MDIKIGNESVSMGSGLQDMGSLVSVRAGGIAANGVTSSTLAAEVREKYDIVDPDLIPPIPVKVFTEYVRPVRAHQGRIRKENVKMGLPFGSPWVYHANQNIDKVIPLLEEMAEENLHMYEKFLGDYDTILDEALMRMAALDGVHVTRDMFGSATELREKWHVDIDRASVPDPEKDVRAGWSYRQVQEFQKRLRSQLERDTRNAIIVLLNEVRRPICNIVDKASRYDGGRAGRFSTETFIGNVHDVVEKMVPMNLADDPEIESLRRQIIKDICDLNPKDLREDKVLLKDAGKKAEAIVSKTDKIINRVGQFGAGLAL